MRNIPVFNFPRFFAAENTWQARGYKVYNPARRDIEEDGFNPVQGNVHPDGLARYLRFDVRMISECTHIALLEGWQQSEGARFELVLARKLNLEVWEEVSPDEWRMMPESESKEAEVRATDPATGGQKGGAEQWT